MYIYIHIYIYIQKNWSSEHSNAKYLLNKLILTKMVLFAGCFDCWTAFISGLWAKIHEAKQLQLLHQIRNKIFKQHSRSTGHMFNGNWIWASRSESRSVHACSHSHSLYNWFRNGVQHSSIMNHARDEIRIRIYNGYADDFLNTVVSSVASMISNMLLATSVNVAIISVLYTRTRISFAHLCILWM